MPGCCVRGKKLKTLGARASLIPLLLAKNHRQAPSEDAECRRMLTMKRIGSRRWPSPARVAGSSPRRASASAGLSAAGTCVVGRSDETVEPAGIECGRDAFDVGGAGLLVTRCRISCLKTKKRCWAARRYCQVRRIGQRRLSAGRVRPPFTGKRSSKSPVIASSASMAQPVLRVVFYEGHPRLRGIRPPGECFRDGLHDILIVGGDGVAAGVLLQ